MSWVSPQSQSRTQRLGQDPSELKAGFGSDRVRVLASDARAAELKRQTLELLRHSFWNSCEYLFLGRLLRFPKAQRHGQQLGFSDAYVSQWTDFLGFVVNVRSHFSEDHFVAHLRISKLRGLLSNDFAHDLSYCVFLRAFDSPVTESDDVDPGKVLVDGAGGEYSIASRAASSDKAS